MSSNEIPMPAGACHPGKDGVSSYVQELNRQKAMLDALVKYREAKKLAPDSYAGLGSEMPAQSSAMGSTSIADLLAMSHAGSPLLQGAPSAFMNPSSMSAPYPAMLNPAWTPQVQNHNPLKVELPTALRAACKEETPGPGQQVQRLQQAQQMLQAAIVNWESCVQDTNSTGTPPVDPALMDQLMRDSSMLDQMAQTQMQAKRPMMAHLASQGHGLPAAPPGLPLVNLNATLPPEAAEMAQSLLETVANDNAEAERAMDQERLKWLARHLENQNKTSIEKLMKYTNKDPRSPGPRGQMQQRGHAADFAAAAAEMQYPGLAGAGLGRNPAWNPGHVFGGLPFVGQSMHPSYGPSYPAPLPGAHNKWWQGEMHSHAQQDLPRKGGGPKKRMTAGNSQGSAPSEGHQSETLRMHLRSLLNVDSNRVLIVRKINRLGFASPSILKDHFAWYGTVENVLVAHSRVKSGGGQAGIVSRLRPSGLGFVVMSKTEEAEAILTHGPEQQVCNTLIRVQKFERRMTDMPDDVELGEEEDQEDGKKDLDNMFKEARLVGA